MCAVPITSQSQLYQYMSSVIVSLYWVIFVLGVLCCQKIHVVETMFMLQFAFVSYLPMDNYCPPFDQLKPLRYAFGWNGLNFGVSQAAIPSFYSSLGYKANFLSNVNFMLLFVAVCPLISPVFFILGKKSRGYRAKPRLLALANSLLLEIPMTAMLVNTPNIITSSVVNFQAFGTSNVIPLAISCTACFLILVTVVLLLAFQQRMREYRLEFCTRSQIGKISLTTSSKIKKLYPLLLFIEIASVSFILSPRTLFDISLYLSLGILLLTSTLKIVISPYRHSIDNTRLFVNQFFLLLINSLQIGFKYLKESTHYSQSTVELFPWSVLVVLVLILFGNTMPYLAYKIAGWVKKRGLIDIALYNQTESIPIKPIYSQGLKNKLPTYYPALEYSMNRIGEKSRKREAYERNVGLRKELLRVERINEKAKEVREAEQGIGF